MLIGGMKYCPPIVLSLALAGVASADLPADVESAVHDGVTLLLQMQEGVGQAEWPYEGVYRVRGGIPIGYRVGGTGIAVHALLAAPDLAEDQPRQDAIGHAVGFIIDAVNEPLMQFARIDSTYDVRGWGYAYGLMGLLQAERLGAIPEDRREAAKLAINFYIDGIEATAIPRAGGWNYARRAGFDAPGAPSPFMTGSTLQALFTAIEAGYEVDADVITAGLDSLEDGRTPAGGWVYSGSNGARGRDAIPGAVGRMLVSETTLYLAGRGSSDRVRGAIDAFIVHWDWLEKRRRQNGTHIPPYGVAPYYFFYAHYFAAQAIEQLPEAEREEYRRRLRMLLFKVREDDGRWNDRVFERSANYGTAMAVLALMMPELTAARWSPPESNAAE